MFQHLRMDRVHHQQCMTWDWLHLVVSVQNIVLHFLMCLDTRTDLMACRNVPMKYFESIGPCRTAVLAMRTMAQKHTKLNPHPCWPFQVEPTRAISIPSPVDPLIFPNYRTSITEEWITIINQKRSFKLEFSKIKKAVNYATDLGLDVHAGHGLTYKSAKIISKIKKIKEFNIGHFLIGESIYIGMPSTIKKFQKILK